MNSMLQRLEDTVPPFRESLVMFKNITDLEMLSIVFKECVKALAANAKVSNLVGIPVNIFDMFNRLFEFRFRTRKDM